MSSVTNYPQLLFKMSLMTLIFVHLGCAQMELVKLIPDLVPPATSAPSTASNSEPAPKKLDFNQLTTKYVQARIKHPQLLELLEHGEWRPHPSQQEWLKHPFKNQPVTRWVLKISPPEEHKDNKDTTPPAKNETPVVAADVVLNLDDLLKQGGISALEHVVYLDPVIPHEDDREAYTSDLKLLTNLKSSAGQHAQILLLLNSRDVSEDQLEEVADQLDSVDSLSSFAQRNQRKALYQSWITALIQRNPADPVKALTPVGTHLREQRLTDELRGELFILLGTYLPPVMIPGLQETFEPAGTSQNKSPSHNALKMAAMEAVLRFAAEQQKHKDLALNYPGVSDPYPTGILQREWDEDPQLRKLYAYWLGLTTPPQGLEILQRQLNDHDPMVRDAVLASLGRYHDKEAARILRKYAENTGENIRLATVAGLAGHGPVALRTLLHDDAYRVRQAVAEELTSLPTLESAVMLKDLLLDENLQVQQSIIQNLSTWPDSLATPLLFQAIINGQRQTRLTAAYQLQQRTGIIISQLDGSDLERREHLLKLAAERGLETNFWNQLLTKQQPTVLTPQDDVHRELLQQWLKQLLDNQTNPPESSSNESTDIELVRADIPDLEAFLKQHPQAPLRQKILDKLVQHCPEFAALAQLRDQNIQKRRQAARQLADYSRQATLSPLLLEEVAFLMQQEQDEQVWRSIAQSISQDSGEFQIRIARIMLQHRWVDLQKLGCDYAADHHLTQLANDILKLFQSRDTNLLVKAVQTSGKLGNPVVIDGPTGGLRSLLNHPDPRVRKEASIALARLRDPQGVADLVRLAHSPDATTRYDAVELMAELGDPTLIKHLHQILWLEQDRRVKIQLIKSLEKLTPEQEWPYKSNQNLNDQEQAKLWIEVLNSR